jgi:hypothetical protein
MAHDLHTALEELRERLLGGDLAGLPDLIARIQSGEAELAAGGSADPVALRGLALRNAACLEGAMAGVRAARRRLGEIASAAQGLSTYDRKGGRALIASDPATTMRRL